MIAAAPPAAPTSRCGRWRYGCTGTTTGIDGQRVCSACEAAGHTRVTWVEMRPENQGCDGTIVIEPLANAGLSELAIHLPPSARDEVATFDSTATRGTGAEFVAFPCGHARRFPPPGGFCGVCNPARMP